MRIAIINTGDELLRGALADENAVYMAGRLYERGFKVDRFVTVGDDLQTLVETFRAAFAEFDLAIVSGGLGPTDDDLTAQAVSEATGAPLEHRPEAEKCVRAAFDRLGARMHELNLKQARLPRGCDVLDNPNGTAPGFAVRQGRCRAFFLPGPPRELVPMFEARVIPELPSPESRNLAAFRLFGIGECDVQAALCDFAKAHPSLVFGYRAAFPEIGLRVHGPDKAVVAEAADFVRRTLGDKVFAEEDVSLAVALGETLGKRGLSLAAAESCTGGLIGHEITQVPGSSAYFKGSVVAYDNAVKTALLGVAPELLRDRGAVSEEVARAMAEGARRALDADLAVATTGIAGPTGGTPDKPVGLVHFAVATSGGTRHLERRFKGFDRVRIKRASAWTAMRLALDAARELS